MSGEHGAEISDRELIKAYDLPEGVGVPGCNAELEWKEEGDVLVVNALLLARKRGDEILAEYARGLQTVANRTGKTVVSRETPTHKGAVRLFERTAGYIRVSDEPENPSDFGTYERKFIPIKTG